MKYYSPERTYRFEVHGSGPVFCTDNWFEAVEVALFRSKYSRWTVTLIDIETDEVTKYRQGYQIL